MNRWRDDEFEVLLLEPSDGVAETADGANARGRRRASALPASVTARLLGFDLEERPQLVGLPGLPHEIVAARSTVSLLRADVGRDVVVLFDGDDVRKPIIVGVVQEPRIGSGAAARPVERQEPLITASVDDERIVLKAEREIVLECGEASVTLTRAGKVLIKGAYVLSRSSGYNKIKGAVVDIN